MLLGSKSKVVHGFTLIEVMVVIVILGLLAGLVGSNVFSKLKQANIKAAKIQINQLGQALDSFRIDNGFYPATEQGLEALVQAPTSGRIPKGYPSGGYLQQKSVPLDPFKEPYNYVSPGINNPDGYDLWSKGPDQEDGTDDDVANWKNDDEAAAQ